MSTEPRRRGSGCSGVDPVAMRARWPIRHAKAPKRGPVNTPGPQPVCLVELQIPASASYLSLARLVVIAAAALGPPLAEDRLDGLRLAVSEACANAIKAHHLIGSNAPVSIRCDLSGPGVSVEVIDRGAGFDPDQLPLLPSPTDPSRLLREGGLGIPLMRELMDRTEIRSSVSGTAVRLEVWPGETPPTVLAYPI